MRKTSPLLVSQPVFWLQGALLIAGLLGLFWYTRPQPAPFGPPAPPQALALTQSDFPQPSAVIDAVSAERLALLSRLSYGFASELAFDPTGRWLAINTPWNGAAVYDTATLRPVWMVEQAFHPLTPVAVSPDGQRLLTLESRLLRLWQANGDSRELAFDEPQRAIFSNDGAVLAATNKAGQIGYWRAEDGALLSTQKLTDANTSVELLAVRHWDGNAMLLTREEGRRIVVRQGRGRLMLILEGDSAAWSADGELLAVRTGNRATLFRSDGLTFRTFGDLSETGEAEPGEQRVALSPDGTLLALARNDQRVQVWRVADASPVTEFVSDHPITRLSFSPTGDALLLGWASYDSGAGALTRYRSGDWSLEHQQRFLDEGMVDAVIAGSVLTTTLRGGAQRSWDLTSGAVITTIAAPPEEPTQPRPFVSESGAALIRTDNDLTLWRSGDGLPPPVAFAVGVLSPDRATLLASDDSTIRLLRTSDGAQLWQVRSSDFSTRRLVRFSPDSALIALSFTDGEVRVWNAADGTLQRILRHSAGGSYAAMVFDPDGAGLYLMNELGQVELRSLIAENVTPLCPDPFGAGTSEVKALAIAVAPDGQSLALSADTGAVALCSLPTGKSMILTAKAGGVATLAFSPDGQQLIGGTDQGVVLRWRVSDGTALPTLNGYDGTIYPLFSPDGQTIMANSSEGTYWRWRAADGALIEARSQTNQPLGSFGRIQMAQQAMLWWRQDGTLERIIETPTGRVFELALSADGATLATLQVSRSGSEPIVTLRLWDSATGTQKRELPLATSENVTWMEFAPGDQHLAIIQSKHLSVVDPNAGGVNTVKLTDETYSSPILRSAAAFAPDGSLLALFDDTGQLRIWRLSDSALLTRRLAAHKIGVNIVFAPDARYLVASDFLGGVTLWGVP
jgi:WD40 repeat protein